MVYLKSLTNNTHDTASLHDQLELLYFKLPEIVSSDVVKVRLCGAAPRFNSLVD